MIVFELKLILLIIPTLCYIGEGILMLYTRDYPGALTWICYGFANVGLTWKFLF
jgi:hypothetical protein